MGCLICLGAFRPNRVDTTYETCDTPENLPDPPQRVFCPRCSCTVPAVYRKTLKNWVCFFVPFPSVDMKEYVLACSKCSLQHDMFPQKPCLSCKAETPFSCEFCPDCGTKKEAEDINLGRAQTD